MVTTKFTVQVVRKGGIVGDLKTVGWTVFYPAGNITSGGTSPIVFTDDESVQAPNFPTYSGTYKETSPVGFGDSSNPANGPSISSEINWGPLNISQ